MADLSTPSSRRSFFKALIAGSVVAAGAGGAGFAINSSRRDISDQIANLTLPKPAIREAPIPSAVKVGVDGIGSFITKNSDFYRIDTALSVPSVSIKSWQLRVHGMVENEFTIDFDELIGYDDLEEHYITLTCVSNEVGGNLMGTAKWLGYPLAKLMQRAKPSKDADMVLSKSIDGYTASTPLEVMMDKKVPGLLTMGMNDEPLPPEHGFPVRMIIPGLYGYVSATKWVVDLEVTRFDKKEAYWTPRGYSAEAPIKTQSRIDTPRPLAKLKVGKVPIGGVAWAQGKGIKKVEIRVDNGEWQEATLGKALNKNTWRQWFYIWESEPGYHQLSVRATDEDGNLQPEQRTRPLPNGADGWHNISVSVKK
jgi:DMSO/TMAO reductase YedYZ molybdopterin-dependent catalytic subunit